MSITRCLKKLGDSVNAEDVDQVRALTATYLEEGVERNKAPIMAAQDVLSDVMGLRKQVETEIKEKGGAAPKRQDKTDSEALKEVESKPAEPAKPKAKPATKVEPKPEPKPKTKAKSEKVPTPKVEEQPAKKAEEPREETADVNKDDDIKLFSATDVPSTDNKTKGIGARKVKNAISDTILTWQSGPQVSVVGSYAGLPPNLQDSVENFGKPVYGVANPSEDSIYLIGENITSKEHAMRVLAHEAVGHFAFEREFQEILSDVYNKVDFLKTKNEQVREIAEEVGKVYKDLPPIDQAAEVVAILSEQKIRHPVFIKLYGAVRNFLRKLGFTVQFSKQDLDAMILKARGSLLRPSSKPSGAASFEASGRFSATVASEQESNTPVDKFAEQNKVIRETDQKAWEKAKKILKRQFSPGGLLPEQVFKEKISRDAQLEAGEFDINYLVHTLESSVKEDYGVPFSELSDNDMDALSEALSGEIPKKIGEKSKVAIIAMRQHIDGLSKDYSSILQEQAAELKASGDVNGAAERAGLLETIASNMGRYVHRSYKVFDDKQWFKKVPVEALNDAREYLTSRYLAAGDSQLEAERQTEVALNEILKNGTAYDSMEAFVKESKLGAKDLSTLKKRKEIAPEIRALMGEYVDPRINFAKTSTKMGRLIWNQRFLDRIKDIGTGNFFFDDKTKPANATAQIAADGSESYAPLNGLWTTPEINQAFKDALGKEEMANWYRAVVKFNGLVKFGKTVLSPTTAARNWQSAFFFTVANGHFDLRHLKKSHEVRREYFANFGDKEKLAYLRKLKELGVVYDTPYAGEMMRLLEESNLETWISGSAVEGKFRDALGFAQKAYQFGDDYWKIIGFENEKQSLIKHKKLSEKEAEIEAAERIRNTYPTYSMVGRGMQNLRKFPLAGTFVSFPAEIIRTSSNMVRYLAQDMKDPGMRPIAMKRAAGLAIVSGLFYAAAELSKSMMGIDDDEEEAIRLQAAPWNRNSNLLFTGRDEKGNLKYIDLSFIDPYNYWKRPINAVMRDQPWEDKMADVMAETLSPFLGTDITAGTIFEVMANKKSTGSPVFKEFDMPAEQLKDIGYHLVKSLQPGIASNLQRTYKALKGEISPSGKQYDLADEGWAWAGWRVSTLDPKTALYYRTFDFQDAKSDSSRTLSQVLNSPNSVSDSDIEEAFERSGRIREKAYEEMFKLIGAARSSGMSTTDIQQTLKSSNISKRDIFALINNRVPEWKPSKTSRTNAIKAARARLGERQARTILERYKTVSGL